MQREAIEVYNAGVPGNNTRQAYERLESDVLRRAPDLVIVALGTNDVLNTGNLIALPEVERNLEMIVGELLRAGCRVILGAAADANEAFLKLRHDPKYFVEKSAAVRLAELRAIQRAVAARHALPLLDLERVLGVSDARAESLFRNNANSGIDDGVHPTVAGYAAIAAEAARLISALTPPARRIVCFGDSITYGIAVRGEGTADSEAETYPGRLSRLLQSHVCSERV